MPQGCGEIECNALEKSRKMEKTISFLKALAANNCREWFALHKEEYMEVKKRVDDLAGLLIGLVAEEESEAARFRPSDVTYRIYRDTRFSNDKTPYKTHIGIFINPPGGKKSMRCGYYFHIEPGACMVCAGNMPLPGVLTRAIRQSIYDETEEYLSIVKSPEFTKYFPVVGSDFLKTAPKGFPRDWEHIDLLRSKDFSVTMQVENDYLRQEGLASRLRPVIRQMKRFNDFINFAIDEALDEPR